MQKVIQVRFSIFLCSLLSLILSGCSGDGTLSVTAKTTPNTNVVRGTAVVLEATATESKESGRFEQLQYEWKTLVAPTGSVAQIQNPKEKLAGFTPDLPGHYEFSIKAGDGLLVTGGGFSSRFVGREAATTTVSLDVITKDECATANLCGANATCTNTTTSYECACNTGYTGTKTTGAAATCTNVNECTTTNVCGANAACTDTVGSYECACSAGYTGAKTTGAAATCVNVNECTTANICGANAACTDTVGSYECACNTGYTGTATTGSAATCTDVDECNNTLVNICGANAACTNTVGSYECACNTGYTGTKTTGAAATCVNVNECATENICGDNATCTDTTGSYECACNTGYTGTKTTGAAATCTNVNECATENICGDNAACTDTVGSYECACNTGYTGTRTTGAAATCLNVNECETENICGDNATCTDRDGTYFCSCSTGYFGEPMVGAAAICMDVDECKNTSICGKISSCLNTIGSYECACNKGYSGTTATASIPECVNVNECLTANSCDTNATCTDTEGSFECACNTGYQEQTGRDGKVQCFDVNECELVRGTCGDNASCSNTDGSYECVCNEGYVGETTTAAPAVCVDVNACENNPCSRGYACEDLAGMPDTADGRTCTDINECQNGRICGPNAGCTNTIGSYECACSDGFSGPKTVGTPTTCVDINECEPTPKPVVSKCFWDVGAQFSVNEKAGIIENPTQNGWSYFYARGGDNGTVAEYLAQEQVLYKTQPSETDGHFIDPRYPISGFRHVIDSGTPAIFTNLSANPDGIELDAGIRLNFGELAYHAGPVSSEGRYAVVRWTAPQNGNYLLDFSFRQTHSSVASFAVIYNKETQPILFGTATPDGRSGRTGLRSVVAGNTIDFVIGLGNEFYATTTGLVVKLQRQSAECPLFCPDVNKNGVCDEFDIGSPCQPGNTCNNTPGSYECVEIDACVKNPCSNGYSCSDIVGGSNTADGRTCVDVDECQASGVCGEAQTCSNTSGSYECACNAGYTGTTATGAPAVCTDIDECLPSPKPLIPSCFWNAAAQFSVNELAEIVENPSTNGWSYLYAEGPASGTVADYVTRTPVLYKTVESRTDGHTTSDPYFGDMSGFINNLSASTPLILTNKSPNPAGLTTSYNAHLNFGEMMYHPGPSVSAGRYNIVRWTAPMEGTYELEASWRIAHESAVDFAIVLNMTSPPLKTGRSTSATTVVSTILSVPAGSTIDFVIGLGTDFSGTSTGFNAKIRRFDESCAATCVDANKNGVCDEFDIAPLCAPPLSKCVNTPGSYRCTGPRG